MFVNVMWSTFYKTCWVDDDEGLLWANTQFNDILMNSVLNFTSL